MKDRILNNWPLIKVALMQSTRKDPRISWKGNYTLYPKIAHNRLYIPYSGHLYCGYINLVTGKGHSTASQSPVMIEGRAQRLIEFAKEYINNLK